MRRQRRLQQNCSEEEEMTTLIAKMKLSQSSAELAIFSLEKERDKGEKDPTWVCTCSTFYKGLELSAKGLAAI